MPTQSPLKSTLLTVPCHFYMYLHPSLLSLPLPHLPTPLISLPPLPTSPSPPHPPHLRTSPSSPYLSLTPLISLLSPSSTTSRELLKTSEGTQEILHSHYNDLRAKVTEIEHQRETATKDFEGLDKSFADLHQRYLRLKQSSDSQQQVCLRVFWHCAAREMPHNL